MRHSNRCKIRKAKSAFESITTGFSTHPVFSGLLRKA